MAAAASAVAVAAIACAPPLIVCANRSAALASLAAMASSSRWISSWFSLSDVRSSSSSSSRSPSTFSRAAFQSMMLGGCVIDRRARLLRILAVWAAILGRRRPSNS